VLQLLRSIVLLPPLPTLFPYTTLFRSHSPPPTMTMPPVTSADLDEDRVALDPGAIGPQVLDDRRALALAGLVVEPAVVLGAFDRSEEHTSELQSRENLVCRLLLEKKKH